MMTVTGSREPTNVGPATKHNLYCGLPIISKKILRRTSPDNDKSIPCKVSKSIYKDRPKFHGKESSYYASKFQFSLRQFWWQRKHKNHVQFGNESQSLLLKDDFSSIVSSIFFTTPYSSPPLKPPCNQFFFKNIPRSLIADQKWEMNLVKTQVSRDWNVCK